jgi:hypothetical protein
LGEQVLQFTPAKPGLQMQLPLAGEHVPFPLQVPGAVQKVQFG